MSSRPPERRRYRWPRDELGLDAKPNPRRDMIEEIERRWLLDLIKRKPHRDPRNWPPGYGEES